MYLLGYDIGSSSIKAALVNANSGETVATLQSPETEMSMQAPAPGWAEQDPETWWQNVCLATKKLLQKTSVDPKAIQGIGISYQMHGLVLVDKDQQVLRPSIIWCDSRGVEIGNKAFDDIGHAQCLSRMLNSPGNFTASKLAWVKENEPAVFEKTDKFMLPGDYIAMRLTGESMTTPGGLSEGILWDFQQNEVASLTLDYFGIDKKLIPDIAPTFSKQGKVTEKAAAETGLAVGIPITYRAGDQPNNAMSLNVLQPGEVAATGGTSGVIYGLVDQAKYDPQSRVNSFLHVNHQAETGNRIGVLFCLNGAGSQYAWIKKNIAENGLSYTAMEQAAAAIPVGSDGLCILPFGNGAERMLVNRDIGAKVSGLQFNLHSRAHFYRAALEGIAFSFVYGMGILKEMGLNVQVMRVGNDNLFQSEVFSNTISSLVGCRIEMLETTGAVGSAKAAGVAIGIYASINEAMQDVRALSTYEPDKKNGAYGKAYQLWSAELQNALDQP